MKKNVVTLTLALLVIFVCSSLFADELTKPIQEGEVVIAPETATINYDREVKKGDFEKASYARRGEIFDLAYKELYLNAITRFPNENLDIRDLKVVWRKAEKDKTTTFTASAQSVRMPEGQYSFAKSLTKPLLENEKQLVTGSVSTNFTYTRKTKLRSLIQYEDAYEAAYIRLVREAQAKYDARADVRAISLKLTDEDKVEATATVIVPAE